MSTSSRVICCSKKLHWLKSLKSKIVVVGLGRSGIGAAKLLHSEGHEVIILESCTESKFQTHAANLREKGIKVEFQSIPEANHFFSKNEINLVKYLDKYIKKETALY